MTPPAIETRDLTKQYGRTLAVDELTMQVERGEIYGFLGLNGAGKSTTIRMLLGMVRPTRGTAQLLGTEVSGGGRGPWNRVGHLVDSAHAYPSLTVRENLELVHRMHGLTETGAVDRVTELLGLTAYRDRRARTLSLGNTQRLGLAKALLHRPDLLILDEPGNGLDPAGIVELRELLHGLAAEQNVAIFMSSHILSEISRLAKRIAIIDRGRLLTVLDAEAVRRRARRRLLVDARDREKARQALQEHGFRVLRREDGGLELDDARSIEHPDRIATLLVGASAPPTTLRVWQEDLEALFMRLLAEHGSEAA